MRFILLNSYLGLKIKKKKIITATIIQDNNFPLSSIYSLKFIINLPKLKSYYKIYAPIFYF
jgi:hypothetical protein